MNDFEFARGEVWPVLLALPLVWWAAWALFSRSRVAMQRYGAAPSRAPASPAWRAARLAVLLALGTLCWMDPRLGDEELVVERRGIDLVVCLDTSRSMLAADMEPTRLGRALDDVRSLLTSLHPGDRIGLVVFAGKARIRIPLTHDVDSFRALLGEIDTNAVAVGGTDLAAALRRAKDLIEHEQQETSAVLLATDGEDLAGAGRQAASELAASGITVHTIGYGSALGSKITTQDGGQQAFLRDAKGEEVVSRLDPDSLRHVAEATGGVFVRAEAVARPLVELFQKQLVPLEQRVFDTATERTRKARYQWVLLPLLLLLLWEIALAGGRR